MERKYIRVSPRMNNQKKNKQTFSEVENQCVQA